MPSEFQFKEPPLALGIPKSRPSGCMDIFWNCPIEVVLKLSTKLCGITSGSHITSILQNSTIPDTKRSKFSFLPFKEVEEISHFRVISKWTPESDASTETADQVRRLISFPVPLELRFEETTISI